jgi:peptidyl-prolyl cis-trans isomerase SurA
MTERLPTVIAMLLAFALGAAPVASWGADPADLRPGDYIIAVVNSELVTAGEVQLRMQSVQRDAGRSKARLPPDDQLRKQIIDQLIDERVQVTYARETGVKVDDADVDRAMANVALQNQLTIAQLRQRLRDEGMDYARFRDNLRDQLSVQRVRDREVVGRIQITDLEIDNLLDKERAAAGVSTQYDIAQILVSVPEGASESETAARRARAETALARVQAGEPFAQVAREMSEDGNKAAGGEIGMRPADRLPDAFVAVVRPLDPGAVAPSLLRTGAGFHVLKLVDRRDAGNFTVTQTRARHILLRASPQVSQEAALRRLATLKREIQAGSITFEQAARDNSEDGSAAQGGDLGWASPGSFVPEFEAAINPLPIGGMSEPFVTRFGAHLVQVVDRRSETLDAKQQREQARNVLREQRFEEAYNDWSRDLRARAYVEMRDAPY